MEINDLDRAVGCVTTEDIVEGRFVLFVDHSWSHDFGSREDLVGVKLPDTADEAAKAKYILTWPVSNEQTPLYVPTPTIAWSLRQGGWDKAANTPFDAKVFLTYPGYTDGETIPSGSLAVAHTDGIYTLPLGAYVADANIIVPGAAIVVSTDGADAGKPTYTAAEAVGVIGHTERYDSVTGALTVRLDE